PRRAPAPGTTVPAPSRWRVSERPRGTRGRLAFSDLSRRGPGSARDTRGGKRVALLISRIVKSSEVDTHGQAGAIVEFVRVGGSGRSHPRQGDRDRCLGQAVAGRHRVPAAGGTRGGVFGR